MQTSVACATCGGARSTGEGGRRATEREASRRPGRGRRGSVGEQENGAAWLWPLWGSAASPLGSERPLGLAASPALALAMSGFVSCCWKAHARGASPWASACLTACECVRLLANRLWGPDVQGHKSSSLGDLALGSGSGAQHMLWMVTQSPGATRRPAWSLLVPSAP